MILLHGRGVNGLVQDAYFQLSQQARALGFYLLLPDGTPNADGDNVWNATPCWLRCGNDISTLPPDTGVFST